MSKSGRAYEWIAANIASGRFSPGYRLVLGQIAAELDMSAVPVREAIRQLEAEGRVEFERNVGARVAMIDTHGYRRSMETLAILEGAATALAAGELTAEDLERARSVNRAMAESLDSFDPSAFTRLNREFHQILSDRCPNHRLTELVSAEWGRLAGYRESTFSFVPGRARASVREHEEIIDAIARGADSDEIEQYSRRHRLATLSTYLRHEAAGPAEADTSHILEEIP